MTRNPRQGVFLVVGSPWLDAIAAIRDGNRGGDPWQASGSFRPGDLLITVLDTDPRAVLCVERVEQGGPDDDPVVLGERRMAEHLPSVPEVEKLAATKFPEHAGPIPARDADRLLDAIAFADMRSSMEPVGGARGVLAEARTRLNSVTVCGLCDAPVDPGDPAVNIHFAHPAEEGEDVDALLCAACSDELAGSQHSTLVQHRLVTRHPQCPRCAAFQTLSVVVGGLSFAPQIAKWRPWQLPIGDAISGDETNWSCDACGYGWEYAFPVCGGPNYEVQEREIVPLWKRNEDNRIVLVRKSKDTDRRTPVSVLCAPLAPEDVLRILAAIVEKTFGGDWDAALTTIVDQPPYGAWEFLDPAVNSFSRSIGDRAREVLYRGEPDYVAVPGVGIAIDYGSCLSDIGVGEASCDYYDVMYGFLIDDTGNVDVLAAQIEHEVVKNGQTYIETEEVWNFLYTLAQPTT